MNSQKYAITFACYNQVEYTRQCVDSMIKTGMDLSRVVVVDNGSTDETRNYLQTLPLGGQIFNKRNLGCGVAWNQGALALQAEWTVIMNNDVLVAPNWIENLIDTAEKQALKIISPALIEGGLDYDFEAFAVDATAKMTDVLRMGAHHAICMVIHESVWSEIGYFQPEPALWGYEDTLFFHKAEKAAIPMAMTGSSWLHHYGSMTQKAIKQERGLAAKEGLGNRDNYRLLQQSWLERKLKKHKNIKKTKTWQQQELSEFGLSLHGLREKGDFIWI